MLNKTSKFCLGFASVSLLVSCSILGGGNDKEELAAEEREGRIEMVLGDQKIEPTLELAGVAINLPAPLPAETWGQAGATASKTVGHIAAGESFDVAWRADAGNGSDKKSALSAPPVATSDTVYVIDSSQVISAFSVETGGRIWRESLDSGRKRDRIGIGAGLAVEDNTLVVASGFGFVAGIDASTGAEVWRTDMDTPMTGAPTIKDGRVFVSSNNNEVFAMDLLTGEVLWSDQAIAESARVLGSPSPAAVEDIVVAPYSSGEVIAYLATNGRRLWDEALSSPGQFTPISSINDIAARPVLSGGLVFAASQSGVLAAIDGRTGSRIWQQPIGSTQAPALVGTYLFIVSTNAELICINAGSGQVFWVKQLEQYEKVKKKKGRITYSGPLAASNRIVLASSEGELLGFDPQTGEQTDTIKLGDPVYIEPIAIQDKLILLTDDARLIAVR